MARMTHGQEISVWLIRAQCVSKGELCAHTQMVPVSLLSWTDSSVSTPGLLQWVMQVHLSGYNVMLLQLVLWVDTIWAHNRFMRGSTSET